MDILYIEAPCHPIVEADVRAALYSQKVCWKGEGIP